METITLDLLHQVRIHEEMYEQSLPQSAVAGIVFMAGGEVIISVVIPGQPQPVVFWILQSL